MLAIPEKRCPRCKLFKPVDCFGKWSRSPDGLRSYCRPCARVIVRESRIKPANFRRRVKYLSRPDVKKRYSESRRQRYQKERERLQVVRKTPEYRAKANLQRWQRELQKATTQDRRAACEEMIAFYQEDVERLSK